MIFSRLFAFIKSNRSCGLACRAFAEKLIQYFGHGSVGANDAMISLGFEASLSKRFEMNSHALEVLLPDYGRFRNQRTGSLQVNEASWAFEGEILFLRVDEVK
jgi:hypothetical protein